MKKPVKRSQSAPKARSVGRVAPKAQKPLKTAPEAVYTMPQSVADWIERAQSIMNHQKGQIERLTAEVKDLKAYQRWAQHRILRSDYE